jgi:hypothetical protein
MNDSYEIIPSEEALALIHARLPKAKRYLAIARTGNHHFNPYHNLTHELGVVYWAYACFVNSAPHGEDMMTVIESQYLIPKLIMAGLFHDHNHSGGRDTDDVNVDRAVDFVLTKFGHKNMIDHFGARWSEIRTAIDCTVFVDGKFPVEPQTFVAKCIRDADLMSIYTNEGRHLLLGLLDEMKIARPLSPNDVDKIVNDTSKFLFECNMYTTFGQYMQANYLTDAVEAFRHLLTSRMPPGNRSPLGGWPELVTLTNQQPK